MHDGWILGFLGAGLVSLAVNGWTLRAAYLDRAEIIRTGKNGVLRAAADAAYSREWRRFTGQALLMLVGIIGLLAAPPPNPYASSAPRIFLRALLVLYQVMLAEAALADRRARRRILAQIDALEVGRESDRVELAQRRLDD